MFTKEEKALLIRGVQTLANSNERARSKSKFPQFAVMYDAIEKDLASLMMKVQAMEVTDEGKSARR